MTVRQKVRALNALKSCVGCGKPLNYRDIIYVEDTKLFGVHSVCITKCQSETVNSFVPLDMFVEGEGNLEKLEAKPVA